MSVGGATIEPPQTLTINTGTDELTRTYGGISTTSTMTVAAARGGSQALRSVAWGVIVELRYE